MPLRILEIIPTLARGGTAKQLSLLAMGLPRDRFEVHVCALDRGGPFLDELRAKEISDTVGPLLAQTYPGYRWRVEPNAKNGIVDIRCEMTDCRYGFRLKLSNWYSATQWRLLVLNAAGEILERSRMSRRGFDEAAFRQLPRDFAGRIAVEV